MAGREGDIGGVHRLDVVDAGAASLRGSFVCLPAKVLLSMACNLSWGFGLNIES